MTEPTARKAGIWTKLAYGFGSVSSGIKDNGFEYFLLLYYGQVLGVDFALVGGALLLAMVVDGITDPVVGYWSDNLRTRMGRRHPFMLFSPLPIAVAFWCIFNPAEGLSEYQLFAWLTFWSSSKATESFAGGGGRSARLSTFSSGAM